ncbi:MAG: LON peptidase substrate-binding domain-containing protein [Bacteroidota bacterium]
MTPESPSEILPLFPLNVVLFPQSRLPLHIFEDRYRILMSESITRDSEFGIILIQDQEIHPVGCTAVVSEVTRRYDDGRMDIIVEGRKRYSLHNLIDMPLPYLSGRISWFDDISEDIDDVLRDRAVELHNEFVHKVFKGSVRPVLRTDIRTTRSFHLVQKSGLALLQRQMFLSMNSENNRLGFLVRHLESMIPALSSKQNIEELAKNDGYHQE